MTDYSKMSDADLLKSIQQPGAPDYSKLSDEDLLKAVQSPQTAPEAQASAAAPTILAPERPHTGYAATVRATMSGENAPDHVQARPVADIAKSYGNYGIGAAEGAVTGAPGIPGDIESTGRRVLAAVGAPVSTEPVLPTSESIGNAVFGQPQNQEQATGRSIGAFASPLVAAKAVKAVAGLTGPLVAGAGTTAAAQDASKAGYVLPPAMASKSPGVVSQGLSMLSGKIKLQQAASAKNEETTTRLATESLGLPAGTPIDSASLDAVRQFGSQAYKAVAQAVPQIVPDNAFVSAAQSLGSRLSSAAQAFPGLVKNKEIEDLSGTLVNAKSFSPEAGVELVRHLRFDATTNLKAFSDPAKQALGLAQRQAADAVDDLMERNIVAAGKPDIIHAYRDARELLARSYDVETATNPATGDVNARMLGALANKGRPLSGQLKAIADAARAFPKAMQTTANMGGTENLGILDAAVGVTHPGAIPALLARPASRSILLSPAYQNVLMGNAPQIGNALSRLPSVNPFALPNSVGPENALHNPVNRPN